jgi:glycosyltransferase involved in cell wall biosynthesis
MAQGLADAGCEIAIAGWSAHTAGHEPLPVKVIGRAGDLLRIHRRVREWRPDVVYVATAHNWPGLVRDIPLALSFRSGKPPLAIHLHGSESQRLAGRGDRALKALSRLLASRAAVILLLSHEEQAEWRRFAPAAAYEVVVNPFVPAVPGFVREPRSPGHVPTLFTVARLIPEKGVFDLLDAFAMVHRRRPCRLLVAGRGSAGDELARRAALMGIEDSVRMLGYVSGDELDSAYRDSDLFVLPSYFAEGFPVAVMEAMGYGLPIVTTRIRGCADHLVEGVHAAFVPARQAETLARTIEQLLDDEGLRARMGRANVAKVGEFGPGSVMPAYAEALRSAVPNGAGAT